MPTATPIPTAAPDPSQRVRDLRGSALKAARTAAGLSAQKLADRVNDRTRGSDLTRDAIYSYERGKVLLNRDAAERLAEVLRMPLGELLAGDPDFTSTTQRDLASDGTIAEGATEPEQYSGGAGTPGGVGLMLAPAERDRLLHARRTLLDHAAPLLQSAEVLVRQLDRARPGSTRAHDFIASFNLVQDDARQLLDAPARTTVLQAQRSAGFDTLHELLDATVALQNAVETGSFDLFEKEADQPASVVRACRTLGTQLTALLEPLRDGIGRSTRLVSGG